LDYNIRIKGGYKLRRDEIGQPGVLVAVVERDPGLMRFGGLDCEDDRIGHMAVTHRAQCRDPSTGIIQA
jgi:hypothetical protein